MDNDKPPTEVYKYNGNTKFQKSRVKKSTSRTFPSTSKTYPATPEINTEFPDDFLQMQSPQLLNQPYASTEVALNQPEEAYATPIHHNYQQPSNDGHPSCVSSPSTPMQQYQTPRNKNTFAKGKRTSRSESKVPSYCQSPYPNYYPYVYPACPYSAPPKPQVMWNPMDSYQPCYSPYESNFGCRNVYDTFESYLPPCNSRSKSSSSSNLRSRRRLGFYSDFTRAPYKESSVIQDRNFPSEESEDLYESFNNSRNLNAFAESFMGIHPLSMDAPVVEYPKCQNGNSVGPLIAENRSIGNPIENKVDDIINAKDTDDLLCKKFEIENRTLADSTSNISTSQPLVDDIHSRGGIIAENNPEKSLGSVTEIVNSDNQIEVPEKKTFVQLSYMPDGTVTLHLVNDVAQNDVGDEYSSSSNSIESFVQTNGKTQSLLTENTGIDIGMTDTSISVVSERVQSSDKIFSFVEWNAVLSAAFNSGVGKEIEICSSAEPQDNQIVNESLGNINIENIPDDSFFSFLSFIVEKSNSTEDNHGKEIKSSISENHQKSMKNFVSTETPVENQTATTVLGSGKNFADFGFDDLISIIQPEDGILTLYDIANSRVNDGKENHQINSITSTIETTTTNESTQTDVSSNLMKDMCTQTNNSLCCENSDEHDSQTAVHPVVEHTEDIASDLPIKETKTYSSSAEFIVSSTNSDLTRKEAQSLSNLHETSSELTESPPIVKMCYKSYYNWKNNQSFNRRNPEKVIEKTTTIVVYDKEYLPHLDLVLTPESTRDLETAVAPSDEDEVDIPNSTKTLNQNVESDNKKSSKGCRKKVSFAPDVKLGSPASEKQNVPGKKKKVKKSEVEKVEQTHNVQENLNAKKNEAVVNVEEDISCKRSNEHHYFLRPRV